VLEFCSGAHERFSTNPPLQHSVGSENDPPRVQKELWTSAPHERFLGHASPPREENSFPCLVLRWGNHKPCDENHVSGVGQKHHADRTFMTANPDVPRPVPEQTETKQQRFERLLSKEQFKPLKAILDSLRLEGEAVRAAVDAAGSYVELLAKFGRRVVLAKQIHEQDCYTRLGRAGGIQAVLPHHDTVSYRTLVTLVNFDATLTTTPESVTFFDARLAELKTLLKA
jgi:hypothetical protein